MVKKHSQFTGYFIPLYLEKKQEEVISDDKAEEEKWEKEDKDDEEKLRLEDVVSDEEDARRTRKRKQRLRRYISIMNNLTRPSPLKPEALEEYESSVRTSPMTGKISWQASTSPWKVSWNSGHCCSSHQAPFDLFENKNIKLCTSAMCSSWTNMMS